MGIHRNVMVGLVDELEDRGLIERRRHPAIGAPMPFTSPPPPTTCSAVPNVSPTSTRQNYWRESARTTAATSSRSYNTSPTTPDFRAASTLDGRTRSRRSVAVHERADLGFVELAGRARAGGAASVLGRFRRVDSFARRTPAP